MNSGRERNILILGGAGFLGTNLAHFLLRRDPRASVTVVDSLDPLFGSTEEGLSHVRSKISFIKGDIRDDKLLAKVVKDQEIIINCAAQTSHPISMENPFLDNDINVVGVLKVLLAVRKSNPKARVVFSSSSTTIGKAVRESIDEDHPEWPLDFYSAHKVIAEKYHHIAHAVWGMETVCLRFANLYGPYGKKGAAFGFLNHFIALTRERKPITVYGDGSQTRNVMFVDDACDALLIAATHSETVGKTLFAVHDEHYSVKEVATAIATVFEGTIEYVPWPPLRKKIDVSNVRISNRRFKALTGWQPRVGLREGLEETKERIKSSEMV